MQDNLVNCYIISKLSNIFCNQYDFIQFQFIKNIKYNYNIFAEINKRIILTDYLQQNDVYQYTYNDKIKNVYLS